MLQEHLKAWSDKVLGTTHTFRLGRMDALWTQRYAVAVDDLNPLYFDAELARSKGYANMLVPPNYLATLRDEQTPGPIESDLLADGTRPDGRPDVPGLQIMGGGQELEFIEPVCCGEDIVGVKSIEAISLKEGRSGQIVTVQEVIRYSTDEGVEKLILRNNMLYRVVDLAEATDE